MLVCYALCFAAILLASSCSPAISDTYEYSLSKEKAESPAKSLDPKLLKAAMRGPASVVSRDAEPVWKPPENSILTVKTGPDCLIISGKDFQTFYDFKKKRIIELNTSAKTYQDRSLFGDISFRKAELKNRIFLGEMMSKVFKGSRQSKFFDNFYSEAMFGFELPEKNSAYKALKSSNGKEQEYKYKEQVVASFSGGAAFASPEKRRQFSRFLIYFTQLHPQIRKDIELSGKIPATLMCYLDNQPVSKQRVVLKLKKFTIGDSTPTIPAEFKESFDPASPLAPVRKRIAELGAQPPANLKEETIGYFQKAVEKKNYLDALLALTEYGLQTGDNLEEQIASIKDQISADADCQKFLAGLGEPQSEKEAMLALGALDMIDRSRSQKSYLIDIFRANLMTSMAEHGMQDLKTAGEADPAKSFLKVLETNPFITGVYHDLGLLYENSYMHPYAWECYDLARKFYPKHPFLKEVTEKEKEITDALPQFFSGDKL